MSTLTRSPTYFNTPQRPSTSNLVNFVARASLALTAVAAATAPTAAPVIDGGATFTKAVSYQSVYRSPVCLLTAVVAGDPRKQTEWPNPVRAVARYQGWSQQTLLVRTVGTTLGAASEVSGPEFAKDQSYIRSTSLGSPRALLTVVVANPFTQTDWPNPTLAAKPVV